MRSSNPATLSYHAGRVGVTGVDYSTHPLSAVVSKLDQQIKDQKYYLHPLEPFQVHPEIEALRFYLLNHAVALVAQRKHPLEPLQEFQPLVETYHADLLAMSTRMFYYLLLICTRESRHEHSGIGGHGWNKVIPGLGLTLAEANKLETFFGKIHHTSSSHAVDTLLKSPPPITLGQYTKFLYEFFDKGSYSKSYGGKAWAAVADVLNKYVHGVLSAELMMDTAFTLCHNNGPIFNKGLMFHMYSGDIQHILDVQRSGQIPQLIASQGVAHTKKEPIVSLHKMCVELLGGEMMGSVDYQAVADLGALGNYSNLIKKQPASNPQLKPMPKFAGGVQPHKTPTPTKPAGKYVEIMPGFSVKVLEVVR